MVKLVLDSGASVTLTPNRNDFCTYQRMKGQVKGLGTMRIVGKGTVKYTVRSITGTPVTLLITNVYHVPDLPIRLVSPQQLVRQYKKRYNLPAECVIRPDSTKLLLNNNIFKINYDAKSNLPIWKTVPGAVKATETLNHHFKSCFLSTDSNTKFPTFAPLQLPSSEDFPYIPNTHNTNMNDAPELINKNSQHINSDTTLPASHYDKNVNKL